MSTATPVGRIVQGSVAMQHQTDIDTNQKLFNADGSPQMGLFLALAFPKVLPNGQPNTEFDTFRLHLAQVAAAAWPQFFPQGVQPTMPNFGCINPKFSWKYQDGDGFDSNGRSVAEKAGFKGHHILKFSSMYPIRCFHEGKFAAHEEIQKPEDIIKRGYWVRLIIDPKSNNATGNQVPGISLYPSLLSFVERGEEIVSGPDAQTAFGEAAVGWRPPASASPIPASGSLPPPPPVMAPPAPPVMAPPAPPAGPQYTLSAALVAQGLTIEGMLAQGWTHETLVQHGHATKNY